MVFIVFLPEDTSTFRKGTATKYFRAYKKKRGGKRILFSKNKGAVIAMFDGPHQFPSSKKKFCYFNGISVANSFRKLLCWSVIKKKSLAQRSKRCDRRKVWWACRVSLYLRDILCISHNLGDSSFITIFQR